jgi:two-component system, NtrC family, response regulator
MHIEVPSLRERVEDIPLLVKHFIEKYADEAERDNIKLTQDVWKALYEYPWPGNVRELENVIERALILKTGDTIGVKELPGHLLEPGESGGGIDLDNLAPLDMPLPEALEKIEEKLIERALEYCGGVQSKAAGMLGISRRVMHYKMKKYGMIT